MARRSINEAAKVFLAAFALGPPIGGIVVMGLLQVLPWIATDFVVPLPEFGADLTMSLLLAVPLSYFAGGASALLAGLALAAWVAWGHRLTLLACLAASLVYPTVLTLNGLWETRASPETVPPVMLHASMIAVASLSSALICYLLLRNSALVRRLNAPGQA
ncbi:MAG: hypothetical protein WDN31_22015 [Hyphomicrobium sp.]